MEEEAGEKRKPRKGKEKAGRDDLPLPHSCFLPFLVSFLSLFPFHLHLWYFWKHIYVLSFIHSPEH